MHWAGNGPAAVENWATLSVRGTPIQLRRVVPYFGQSRPSILIEFDDAAAVGGESKFAAAEFNSRQEVHAGGNAGHNRLLAYRIENKHQPSVCRFANCHLNAFGQVRDQRQYAGGAQHLIGQPDGGRSGTAEIVNTTLPTRWEGAFA